MLQHEFLSSGALSTNVVCILFRTHYAYFGICVCAALVFEQECFEHECMLQYSCFVSIMHTLGHVCCSIGF